MRQWWRAVALTLVVSVVCVLLGVWQLDRREQRLERIAEVEANYDATPVPLADVLPGARAALPDGGEFTPVEVTGTYDAGATVLVRNRPLDGAYGYLVLVPLVLDGGAADAPRVLVVDRGWVPSGADGSRPDRVPPPPDGPVRVVGRLRPPEPADDRGAPAGQVQRIDLAGSVAEALDAAAEGTGDPGRTAGATGATALVTGAYAQLAVEDPAPERRPAALPRPPADEGPHLGYSLQWFVFAAGLWGFLVVHVRRTARDAAGGTAPPPRRRRRDEDAEDAALDAAEAASATGRLTRPSA